MPIYEYLCTQCGNVSEHLVFGEELSLSCPQCGSENLRKLLSAPSTASGVKEPSRVPGSGDTACCGSSPATRGCVPGSCCGKA